jgi:hypothetical protein
VAEQNVLLRVGANVADFVSKMAKVEVSTKGFEQTMKSLPEKLGKAQLGILAMQNAAGSMGGQIGKVTQQIGGVVSMLATGGPLGVALAAASVAVGALSKYWEVLE